MTCLDFISLSLNALCPLASTSLSNFQFSSIALPPRPHLLTSSHQLRMPLAPWLDSALERHRMTNHARFELDPWFLAVDFADVKHCKNLRDSHKQCVLSDMPARTYAPPVSKCIHFRIGLRVRPKESSRIKRIGVGIHRWIVCKPPSVSTTPLSALAF
jgi:hypothetical protein